MAARKIKKIEEMIKESNQLKSEIARVENRLFKTESEYLELTQGCSLMRNLEFYIHAKPEKKRSTVEEDERVFAMNYPTQKAGWHGRW